MTKKIKAVFDIETFSTSELSRLLTYGPFEEIYSKALMDMFWFKGIFQKCFAPNHCELKSRIVKDHIDNLAA